MKKEPAPGSRRATLKDVAERAGVSMMTVSRILNGTSQGRPETRAAVERAARELDYHPNIAAKALVLTQKIHRIALLFDRPNAAAMGEIMAAIYAEAGPPDVRLIAMRICRDDDPRAALRMLRRRHVDGVILPPPLCEDARLRIVLGDGGIRIAGIGCGDGDTGFSSIGIDDTRAAFELTSYLLRLGHRRIGFLSGHARHRSAARRRFGFESALNGFGIQPDPALQWEGDGSFATAMRIAGQALSADPPPTAILASDDDLAAAALQSARERGIAVPRSLSVCGFDDGEVARTLFPELTRIDQWMGEMAGWGLRQLAGELAAVARGEVPAVRRATLDYRILFGGTDAPPVSAGQPFRMVS
ncbi:LacI family DNA-binding transcriptional regulator [Sphingomonas canadensis]|uniref:LacI family DNA-binding transcriptional regulator n=1 Tax=Sphingomonas canadensis TaxID=1219257 RepID=A0ABW3H5L2_9SPHN|nr:LacI family DNA-binding transcriptional regulator [Sphingomonas canadensis]MCW3836474.1 LacI family transcriptional regulator [Sphingomonas canadensis]